MEDKDIYKTQDQFIADWLDILSRINNGKQRVHRSGTDEDLEISQSESDDILNKKLQRALDHEASQTMPLLQLIKKLKLNLVEIKIILFLYLGYIESGFQRGDTLLSILDLLTESPDEAFLLRRKICASKSLTYHILTVVFHTEKSQPHGQAHLVLADTKANAEKTKRAVFCQRSNKY